LIQAFDKRRHEGFVNTLQEGTGDLFRAAELAIDKD